jgi:hypothetical protein
MLTVRVAAHAQDADNSASTNLKTKMSPTRFMTPAPAEVVHAAFFANKTARKELGATISKPSLTGKCSFNH